MSIKKPSLSIIIPALNEAETIVNLLQGLVSQKDIAFETIVVDGGSRDNTRDVCENFQHKQAIQLKVLASSRSGRAVQMNQGVNHALADELLFLHADTTIDSDSLLADAGLYFSRQRNHYSPTPVAGHFGIRFTGTDYQHRYYFYESKTFLNRPDSINGDQGLWIEKIYFNQLGTFDESLSYMEDARLASKIFQSGKWVTLPGTIGTSARRFEIEGFARRQLLNSFLCNFNAMGVTDFFVQAQHAYREQTRSQKLELRPFLKLAHRQINAEGIKTAINRWYQTGAYIAFNSWQLAFALDCRKNRKLGKLPGEGLSPVLDFYDRRLASLAQWPLIKLTTSLLTIIWFYSLFLLR